MEVNGESRAMKAAILVLEDNSYFEGYSFGDHGTTCGEVVFNTATSGYQEVLTDPSYVNQIVLFTTSHLGNVGINPYDFESKRIWCSGAIAREITWHSSHWQSQISLPDWMKAQRAIGIYGIDTRSLTKKLSRQGALRGCITTELNKEEALKKVLNTPSLIGQDLTSIVTCQSIFQWTKGSYGANAIKVKTENFKVIVYDFGIKASILSLWVDRGCEVWVVPARTSAEEVMALHPDGVVLSNGPGDPAAAVDLIAITQALLKKNIPLLGICLGFQLIALALKARTYKMKFGHHGINQPVIENETKKIFITSQNHSFGVKEDTLPEDYKITHTSLFDGSIQGFQHRVRPIIGIQGHPEASPGPKEWRVVFDDFMNMMRLHKR